MSYLQEFPQGSLGTDPVHVEEKDQLISFYDLFPTSLCFHKYVVK